MNTFFEINNRNININKIREISIASNDSIKITFDDESSQVYRAYGDARSTIAIFEKSIVQIAPCTSPLYNVYKNDDGSYCHESVFCFALCADGIVRTLSSGDYIDLAEISRNYVGCYNKNNLKEFPESILSADESAVL